MRSVASVRDAARGVPVVQPDFLKVQSVVVRGRAHARWTGQRAPLEVATGKPHDRRALPVILVSWWSFSELRKDGTFFNTECDNFLTKKCRSFTGKYRVMGNRLILELPTG